MAASDVGITKASRSLTIREAIIQDAESLARLSSALGYRVSPAVIQHRIRKMTQTPGHAVYIACLTPPAEQAKNPGTADPEIVGWVEIKLAHSLTRESQAEIDGFFVASESQSFEIRKELLAQAEKWAKEQGAARVVLSIPAERCAEPVLEAPEGYARIETLAVFKKEVP
jgi:GNAT superfamily N-acetyltransferase